MVKVSYTNIFEKRIKKIKNQSLKTQIIKQIGKIIENPEIGKPMMHNRKGTREVYVVPFRLSYSYIEKEDKLIFLDLYHKDEQ